MKSNRLSKNTMKAGAYIFALLFIGFFFWFAFNDFSFPKILFGETKKALGIVEDIDVAHADKGVKHQILYYRFKVNGKEFKGQSNNGILTSTKKIGDTLVIEFEVEDPQEHKVLGKLKSN